MPIIGHKHILDFFDKSIERGTISHAYCFVGPTHVGKRAVAEEISGKLLHVPREKLTIHPDMFFVERLVDEKTDALKKDISIDQIINLRNQLARSSFYGGYSIAMLDGGEFLNAASANALLKTLEEPKAKTVLLILTTNERALPDTILSRCQRIFFGMACEGEIAEFTTKEIAAASHGRPGVAVFWANNPDAYAAHQGAVKQFRELWHKPLYEKIQELEPLFGDKRDPIATRGKIHDMLDVWELTLRDMLLQGKQAIHPT